MHETSFKFFNLQINFYSAPLYFLECVYGHVEFDRKNKSEFVLSVVCWNFTYKNE